MRVNFRKELETRQLECKVNANLLLFFFLAEDKYAMSYTRRATKWTREFPKSPIPVKARAYGGTVSVIRARVNSCTAVGRPCPRSFIFSSRIMLLGGCNDLGNFAKYIDSR